MVLGTLTVEGITESQEDGIISILWCDNVSPSGISGISGISRISGITKRGAIGLSHGCMPREKKKRYSDSDIACHPSEISTVAGV